MTPKADTHAAVVAKESPNSVPVPPMDAEKLRAHRAEGTLWTEVMKEQEGQILPLACMHMRRRAEREPAVGIEVAREYLSRLSPHAPGSEKMVMSTGGYEDDVLRLTDGEGRTVLFVAAR